MLSVSIPWLSHVATSSPSLITTAVLLMILLGSLCLAFSLRQRKAPLARSQSELMQLHVMVDRLRAEVRAARSHGESADHLVSALNRIRLQLPPDDLRR